MIKPIKMFNNNYSAVATKRDLRGYGATFQETQKTAFKLKTGEKRIFPQNTIGV